MKKFIIIFAIVIAVIIGVLAAAPLLFKQKLLVATKSTINKNINAKVEFADFHLSFFKHFPKVSLGLENVVVTGKGEFQSDTLLRVQLFQASMSLKSLFSSSGRSIEEINLEQPKLHLISGKTGNVNWDLTLPESNKGQPNETTVEEVSSGSSFQLQLDKIKVDDARVRYEDRATNMLLDFNEINIDVAGKMYGTATELLVNGVVEQFSTEYGGTTYIAKTRLETRTLLNIDYDKMDISIKENELLINRLPLEVTGTIQIPSDSIFFNLGMSNKFFHF